MFWQELTKILLNVSLDVTKVLYNHNKIIKIHPLQGWKIRKCDSDITFVIVLYYKKFSVSKSLSLIYFQHLMLRYVVNNYYRPHALPLLSSVHYHYRYLLENNDSQLNPQILWESAGWPVQPHNAHFQPCYIIQLPLTTKS